MKEATKDLKTWSFDGSDSSLFYLRGVIPLIFIIYSPDGKKLERDPATGAFNSADLAAILHNGTEASASALKARGTPEVLRVVEVMGIEQARAWGACTVRA